MMPAPSKAEREAFIALARRGVEARSRKLSKARKKEIAAMGGKARWAKRNGS